MSELLTKGRTFFKSPIAIIVVSIVMGCAAFPITLHHLTLTRIREANFDAIRFAASSPDQLRTLPVVRWRDGEKIDAPAVQKMGWEQYQMTLPNGEASTIIDIDLRSTMLPLMLGFGGGLRILSIVMLSGVVSFFLLRSCSGWCAIIPPPLRQSAFGGRGGGQGEGGYDSLPLTPSRQDPLQQITFLHATMHHIPSPAFYFDIHHQLAHWNAAAQSVLPHMALTAGIHVLDLSAHLPWGNDMLEKMDEVAQQPALLIHNGDSLCVIPG
jgi:hypothetical protein